MPRITKAKTTTVPPDLNTTAQTDAAAPSAQAVFGPAVDTTGWETVDSWENHIPSDDHTTNLFVDAPIPESMLDDNLYEGANNQIKARHTDDHTTNPYLLESSTILGELAYEAVRARAVIQQLDAEIDHLNQDAAFQIRRIEARRDIELEQRNRRKDDLMKIVSADIMLNGEKQGSDQ